MRFTRFFTLYAAFAAALLYPSTAVAQNGDPCAGGATTVHTDVTTPLDQATLGRTFNLQGKVTVTQPGGQPEGLQGALVIVIDDAVYIDPSGRAAGGGIDYLPSTNNDGTFNISIDLNGENVVSRPLGGSTAIADGRHEFQIGGYFDGCIRPEDALLSLTVASGAAPAPKVENKVIQKPLAKVSPRSVASPTPSPLPSPSAAVTPQATGETKGASGFNPWLAALIGLLGGGALVAGAEYSAHRYHRRHPK
jgi:hypothetical protein